MKILLLSTALLLCSLSITAQSATCACCTESHAEFDFWIGSWEVTNPNGTKAGDNTIEKVQGNCILRENWVSATPGGYTGTSYNFYNLNTKQWEQIWIDNQGVSLHLKGNKEGHKMIMRTDDAKNAKGETFFHRMTWTNNPDGTIRQLWETITEKTNSTIAFDGLYKRKL